MIAGGEGEEAFWLVLGKLLGRVNLKLPSPTNLSTDDTCLYHNPNDMNDNDKCRGGTWYMIHRVPG